MQRLTVAELDAAGGAYDEAVVASRHVDQFCSSSDWILPANAALMGERSPWLWRGGGGWIALMHGEHDHGFRYLEPFEARWGLSSPIVGPDSAAASAKFAELARQHAADWDVLVLSGLVDDAPWKRRLLALLARHYDVRVGTRTQRHVASLSGGLDGFLSRRSRNLRRSIDRAVRRVADAGIEIAAATPGAGGAALYERIQAVEARSWKGRDDVGINVGRMREFYRVMLDRLVANGRLRLMFARRDDQDVGYILGGVLGDTYRGLQFSFDADTSELGLGNACQYAQVRALCDAGIARYDLGTTGIGYKLRWAETTVDSTVVIALQT